jgi:phosphopantothenoylcysteine decarboxylase/phosphopantothenate--cysteine ligase
MQKKILLIITGSIAAHKAIDLVNLFNNSLNYKLQILLTNGAKKFVKESDFSQENNLVNDDLFDWEQEKKFGHINLSRDNDLIIIYPATADIISRINIGRADDLASAIILASNKKIFIAPAMNVRMWYNPITQKNLGQLAKLGMNIIAPNSGVLACKEEGMGRAKEPVEMFDIIEDYFICSKKLVGKEVLITAGGTIEKIDPVRYIGNFSSGKQAIALANQAINYGAKVTLIVANIAEKLPENCRIIKVESAAEMQDEVKKNIKKHIYDAAFMVAAVADYKVQEVSNQKIKKSHSTKLTLNLVKNPDILTFLAKDSKCRPKLVVGFAAESENLLANAQEKLINKKCDYIVANNIKKDKVFANSDNNIILINKSGVINKYQASKLKIADFLIKQIFNI